MTPFFHRVVPGFVIQGGNSDHPNTWLKRKKNRKVPITTGQSTKGTNTIEVVLSIPSSEEENPHKLASPYEFFHSTTKREVPTIWIRTLLPSVR